MNTRQIFPLSVESAFEALHGRGSDYSLWEVIPHVYPLRECSAANIQSTMFLDDPETISSCCTVLCDLELRSIRVVDPVYELVEIDHIPSVSAMFKSRYSPRIANLSGYGLSLSGANSLVARRCTSSTSLQRVLWCSCHIEWPYSRIGCTRLLYSCTKRSLLM